MSCEQLPSLGVRRHTSSSSLNFLSKPQKGIALKLSSSPKPLEGLLWNFAYIISQVSATKIAQTMKQTNQHGRHCKNRTAVEIKFLLFYSESTTYTGKRKRLSFFSNKSYKKILHLAEVVQLPFVGVIAIFLETLEHYLK